MRHADHYISQHELGKSDDPDLSGIEMHWHDGGKDIDAYTSMFVEGVKP